MCKGRASLALACISARLLNILKYVIISVIYGYLLTVIYLKKFRAATAIGDFASITLTEHRDIVVVGKALDVRSRNFLGDSFMPLLHWLWLDRKPWVILLGVHYSKRIHHRPEPDELDDRVALALVLENSDLPGVRNTVKTG